MPSCRGMRLRELGMVVGLCAVLLATNMLCFHETLLERKNHQEKLQRVQGQLDEERKKTAALEKRLASLPPPSEEDSRTQAPKASAEAGAWLAARQGSPPSPADDPGSSQGPPPTQVAAGPPRSKEPHVIMSRMAEPVTQGNYGGGSGTLIVPSSPPPSFPPAHAGRNDVAPAHAGGNDGGAPGTTLVVPAPGTTLVVPVIVMACCRPEYLEKTLRVLQNRTYTPPGIRFEIIVSQDGAHLGVKGLMRTTFPEIRHQQHFGVGSNMNSYYKIARHYKWAFGQVFEVQEVEWAIVLEDDLEIAPDFFHYMVAGAALLKRDSSLWTVTAWNDNSFPGMVESPKTVYRSDFFGGLGWIMTRSLWQELAPKWPEAYWDDWMRDPPQRQGRACIRPEISRTVTFGKMGASYGQFFGSHLSRMVLNRELVDFTQEDWSYLIKSNYDGPFLEQVAAAPLTSLHSLQTGSAKLTYNSLPSFKGIALKLGIMADAKAGVPRTGYRGVVTLRRNGSSLYIAPEQGRPYYEQGLGG